MQDDIFMKRCLELALLGKSEAAPNPMVGSVIVYNNTIIGEGYHEKYGEAHAEVNAINSVKDKNLLSQSTLYVNLEPCAHYGKTPPCSLLIKEMKIPKVVIGCIDPFSKVAGKGVEIMKNAGVDVKIGVLEKESIALNCRFMTFHAKQRPYIILKWAESIDGFMDSDEDIPKWLTNEESRSLVHKMRAEEAAIMVGTKAAIKDNPSLSTRSWHGQNPIRISLDRTLKIPTSHHLLDERANTIIFTECDKESTGNLIYVKLDYTKDVIPQCLSYLYKAEINSIIVEGGEILLTSFIKAGLWDEAWQYIGPQPIKSGIKAPFLDTNIGESTTIGDVKLNTYKRDEN